MILRFVHQTLTVLSVALLITSGYCQDDDDFQVIGYKKDTAAKKKPVKPAPKPAPPPVVAPPPPPPVLSPELPEEMEADAKFSVGGQDETPGGVDRCEEFSSDPCVCSSNPDCRFDEVFSKCVTADSKFSGKLTCQRQNMYYAFGPNVVCPNLEDKGDCATATTVYGINLNGKFVVDSREIPFRPEENFAILNMDTEGMNSEGTATCEVQGAAPPENTELYGTYIEGKGEKGSCVSYAVPLFQEGEYELTLKTLSDQNRCFDIKLGGVAGANNVDLMKLAGDQECSAVDIVFLILVEDPKKSMHIKGHQSPVPINGGFSLKFCCSCDSVPNAMYRGSAISMLRFGTGTKKFENVEISIKTLEDGSQIFSLLREMPKKEKKLLPAPVPSGNTNVNVNVNSNKKVPPIVSQPTLPTRKKCSSIMKYQSGACKKAGCEYNIVTGSCVNADSTCAGTVLGKMNCFRANSLYASGGVLCRSNQEMGSCELKQIIQAMSISGTPLEDDRGIQYVGTDLASLDQESDVEYVDIGASSDVECRDKATKQIKIKGVSKKDSRIYETLARGKGQSRECLQFPISDVVDGVYELAIKTLEPFYTVAGKRAFNIRINDQTIVTNFDVAFYVGNCAALDLIVQLEVKSGSILVTGFPQNPIVMDGNGMTLSFCYSDDQNDFDDTGYVVSGFYLAMLKGANEGEGERNTPSKIATKPLPRPVPGAAPAEETSCRDCSKYDGNPRGCKEANLEYNLVEKKCVKRNPDCEKLFSGDLQSFCRRPNAFYTSAGVLCKNKKSGGNCGTVSPIHGVNLGSDKDFVDLTRGITYREEGQLAADPAGVKESALINGKCPAIQGATVEETEDLYSTLILAKKGTAESTCVAYDIPICQDGSYELSIKIVDLVKEGQRCLDIKIDDIQVIIGMDVTKTIGGASCEAAEFILPITVESYGGGEGMRVLNIHGHTEPSFVEGKFQLKFCSCEWKTPHSFLASAFSLVRFGEGTTSCDVCGLHNGSPNSCTEIGCDYKTESQTCNVAVAVAKNCEDNHNNPQGCKKDECEYNLATGQCTTPTGEDCKPALFGGYGKCQREGAHYLDAGVACKSLKDSPECSTAETVWAVNLNGKQYISAREISYAEEEPTFSVDPRKLKVAVASNRFCINSDEEFLQLLGPSVQGDALKKNGGGCLSYTIPVCQDGSYELSILMVDGFYNASNQRCFDIKLNGVTVALSVDLFRLTGQSCTKGEIIILFKVSRNMLKPLGHSKPIPIDGKVSLSFCYGTCGFADPVFQASAFSLVRFEGGAIACDKCSIHDQNQDACEKDECEYNVATKKCAISEKAAACKVHSDDACRCVSSDCRFDTVKGKCTLEQQDFEGKFGCRRPNTYYAFSPKLHCKNDEPAGDCTTGGSVFGVNLNGPDYVDSEGIKYKKDATGMSIDPKEMKKVGELPKQCKVGWVKDRDFQNLWTKYVSGAPQKASPGACISYPVQLQQDGDYELRIKMIDGIFKMEKKRCFDIKINDVPVALDIDLVALGGAKDCGATNIGILFIVGNNKKTLRIKGHGTKITIANGFHLQLCYGSCTIPNVNRIFQVSAISIFRFGDDTEVPKMMKVITFVVEGDEECDAYSGLPCDCALNNCRYDTFSEKCVAQNAAWKNTLPCRRDGQHYTFGSQLTCKIPKALGDCSSSTTVYGINFGGNPYTDSNGMKFIEERESLAEDPKKLKQTINAKCPVLNAKGSDGAELYATLISGVFSKVKAGECIAYAVPIQQDGEYELIVKTMEHELTQQGKKLFDIKINDVPVAVDVDLMKLGQKQCTAIDIVVLFLIDNAGTALRLKGQAAPVPINNAFQLQFCYSSAKVEDSRFQVSAIAVNRFGADTIVPETPAPEAPAPETSDPGASVPEPQAPLVEEALPLDPLAKKCAEADRNFKTSINCPRIGCAYNFRRQECESPNTREARCYIHTNAPDCTKAGCKYDRFTGWCYPGDKDAGRCGVHKKNAVACKKDGCEYNLVEEQCVAQMSACSEDIFSEFSYCRRANSVYSSGGVLCKSQKSELCTEPFNTIKAVNLGGPQYWWMGPRYLDFLEETPESYKDPSNLRTTTELTNQCGNQPDEMFNTLLATAVTGVQKRGGGKGCLSYPVKLGSDGKYELTIWSVDGTTTALNKRCFDIMINSVTVVFGVDPMRIGGRLCASNEINIFFKVFSSRTLLLPQGFTTPIVVYDDTFSLDFCFGTCGFPDTNFQVSAFSVVQFKVERCRRKDLWYAYGPKEIRIMEENKGRCSQSVPLYGVNLNAKNATDANNFRYQGETSDMVDDPLGFRKTGKHKSTCVACMVTLAEGINIYPTYITGNTDKMKPGDCVSYKIPVQQDGEYELVIKTMEGVWTGEGKRHFDIKINDDLVAENLDLWKLGQMKCKGLTILILLYVEDSAQTMRVEAHYKTIELKGGFDLKFCRPVKSDAPDQTFIVNAFSLSRLGEDTRPLKLEPTSRAPAAIVEGDPCKAAKNDEKECREAGCQFDLVRKFCVGKLKASAPSDFVGFPSCRREGAFYGTGGVLSKNERGSGDCSGDAVVALNLNGNPFHYWPRNIFFTPDTPMDYDMLGIRTPVSGPTLCPTLNDQLAVNLLRPSISVSHACIIYKVPIAGDGDYELSLWLLDGDSDEKNRKCLDVQLNSRPLLSKVDPLSLEVSRCTPFEVVVLFKVVDSGRLIFPNGFSSGIPIVGDTVSLSVCPGKCGQKTPQFPLSSLYVMKLKSNEAPQTQLRGRSNPGCNCRHKKWEYNSVTKECSQHKLTCRDSIMDNNDCRRANGIYVNEGNICKQTASLGNCFNRKLVMSVNINGPDFTDSNGIFYRSYNSMPATYKPQGAQVRTSSEPIYGVPKQDIPMYGTYLIGTPTYVLHDCLRYDIPILPDNGYRYELIFTFLCNSWGSAGDKTFIVKLNGIKVADEFDMLAYVESKYHPGNLIILFQTISGGKVLKINGYPLSIISRGSIPFELCHGTCAVDDMMSAANWHISGLAVHQW